MNIIKCIRRDGVSDYEWVCEITKFMDRYITWKNKKICKHIYVGFKR